MYGQPREASSQRTPAVVSMVQDDHPALAQGLLRALQEQRAAASDNLILAKDWADFEKRRGLVQGLLRKGCTLMPEPKQGVSRATPNTVLITAECQDEANKLRVYCESKFPVGPLSDRSVSVTGENFKEVGLYWREGLLSPAKAREAAQRHFDIYASGKSGTLYWRVAPEIALSTARRAYAYYKRLHISDKPRKD